MIIMRALWSWTEGHSASVVWIKRVNVCHMGMTHYLQTAWVFEKWCTACVCTLMYYNTPSVDKWLKLLTYYSVDKKIIDWLIIQGIRVAKMPHFKHNSNFANGKICSLLSLIPCKRNIFELWTIGWKKASRRHYYVSETILYFPPFSDIFKGFVLEAHWRMCETSLKLYHIKNKHPASMSGMDHTQTSRRCKLWEQSEMRWSEVICCQSVL